HTCTLTHTRVHTHTHTHTHAHTHACTDRHTHTHSQTHTHTHMHTHTCTHTRTHSEQVREKPSVPLALNHLQWGVGEATLLKCRYQIFRLGFGGGETVCCACLN